MRDNPFRKSKQGPQENKYEVVETTSLKFKEAMTKNSVKPFPVLVAPAQAFLKAARIKNSEQSLQNLIRELPEQLDSRVASLSTFMQEKTDAHELFGSELEKPSKSFIIAKEILLSGKKYSQRENAEPLLKIKLKNNKGRTTETLGSNKKNSKTKKMTLKNIQTEVNPRGEETLKADKFVSKDLRRFTIDQFKRRLQKSSQQSSEVPLSFRTNHTRTNLHLRSHSNNVAEYSRGSSTFKTQNHYYRPQYETITSSRDPQLKPPNVVGPQTMRNHSKSNHFQS